MIILFKIILFILARVKLKLIILFDTQPAGQSRGLYVAIANYDASKEKNKSNKVSLEVRESVRVVSEDSSGK